MVQRRHQHHRADLRHEKAVVVDEHENIDPPENSYGMRVTLARNGKKCVHICALGVLTETLCRVSPLQRGEHNRKAFIIVTNLIE